MRNIAVPIALLTALAIAGCSGDTGSAEGVSDRGAASAAPTTGCTRQATEELYVRDLFDCGDTSVYMFNTADARDSWRQVAEGFGSVVVREGDMWLIVKN